VFTDPCRGRVNLGGDGSGPRELRVINNNNCRIGNERKRRESAGWNETSDGDKREAEGEATEGMHKPRRPRLLRWAKAEEGPLTGFAEYTSERSNNISHGLARMIHVGVRTANEGQSIFSRRAVRRGRDDVELSQLICLKPIPDSPRFPMYDIT
jgi:hypothetical protein